MTSDFVEQFGFSEEEFAEQEECIGSVVTCSVIQLIDFHRKTVVVQFINIFFFSLVFSVNQYQVFNFY